MLLGIIPIQNLRRARLRVMWLSGAALRWKNKGQIARPGFLMSGRIQEMRLQLALLTVALASTSVGCAHQQISAVSSGSAPTLAGDAAHPGQTKGWVDTRLYFGLGPADNSGQGVSEAQWRAFLDKQVTPRFPAGLSVVDVYGQWKSKDRPIPERLRSKVLIIDYPDTEENRSKIEAIRAAWKLETGDQSVMRVTEPADVSF